MNIFVDESGNFSVARNADAWCNVVAYVSPESDRKALEELMWHLRYDCSGGTEVKLSHMSELRYEKFLLELSKLRGVAFAVALDAHRHTEASLRSHQLSQANEISKHINKLHFEKARKQITDLSEAIRSLPVQLYAQLICQVELFHKVISRSITYFAQRQPPTLGSFRWRIDQKNTIPTAFEITFRKILPGILQTKSFSEPILMLSEFANYRFFKRFEYASGTAPTYLKDVYGIDVGDSCMNVGKIVSEDFRLVDSAKVSGVQVADLLASGIRRAMRGHFDDPKKIATLIGRTMLQEKSNKPPVQLLSIGSVCDATISCELVEILMAMTTYNRPYVVR